MRCRDVQPKNSIQRHRIYFVISGAGQVAINIFFRTILKSHQHRLLPNTMSNPPPHTSTSTALLLFTAASAAAGASLITAAYMRRQRPHHTNKGDAQVDPACVHSIPAMRSRLDHTDPTPRTGYLCWDDYFMAIAFLSAQRSKDPNKQVGACIVSRDHVILGIGYNGFPRGCCDSKLPWAKVAASGNPLDTKYPYVCHAEMNALLNKNAACVDGAVRT